MHKTSTKKSMTGLELYLNHIPNLTEPIPYKY